jgi:hypothetical protein
MLLDPNHEKNVLAKRAKDKALAQARAAHIAKAADHEGKVKVWDVKTGQSRVLWAVDAREQIERGVVTLEPPVVEMPVAEPSAGQPEDELLPSP